MLKFPIYSDVDKYFLKSIRSNFDVIEIWMRSVQLVLLQNTILNKDSSTYLYYISNKINRIFISNEDRLFSVNFPFKIVQCEQRYKIYTIHSKLEISYYDIANILEFLNSRTIDMNLDNILDDINTLYIENYNALQILFECLFTEHGYIRYDLDAINEHENIHPLNHLDIYFSDQDTFKLGLKHSINLDQLLDILNEKTNCWYLYQK